MTVYNEPVAQPGAPEDLDVEALLGACTATRPPPLEGKRRGPSCWPPAWR